MRKLKVIWFWLVAFTTAAYYTLKGSDWHYMIVDFEVNDRKRDIKRRRLVARNSISDGDKVRISLAWETIPYW